MSEPSGGVAASPQSKHGASAGQDKLPGRRKVALLGAGYIADWHAQCLRTVAGVDLVAVCDRVAGKAQALAARFAVPGVYGSLDRMLVSEPLDAVHILLPPNLHFEAARAVLDAGVDVLLEKPMCDSAEDCNELVRMAAGRGRRLGVGHNFLFAPVYEQLRRDIRAGVLGRLDWLAIGWRRPLPQIVHGPFDTWMLRDPRNILIEIGSHLVSQVLDLAGEPGEITVRPGSRTELANGRAFYRHWLVDAVAGKTAVSLQLSFAPGFSQYSIEARGTLAAATVDFERNTYTLDRRRSADPDFEARAIVVSRAKSLRRQAGVTLSRYIRSKLHLEPRGNAYGESIARAMDSFYAAAGSDMDARIDGQTGARVIRICRQMASLANLPAEETAPWEAPKIAVCSPAPRILVLGGTGFIGKEVLRQLIAKGRSVRLLARGTAGIPAELRASTKLECIAGDIADGETLLRAMDGMECVVHLARAHVKTWADYCTQEIDATRRVAECAVKARVARLVYAGTIDSYYLGAEGETVTEATSLDARIERRNLYARAKAASEELLVEMHREHGLPLVIVRPGIVIGRGGSPFHWGVGRWWSDAVCELWGSGKNKLPLVLVEDAASGLIAATQTAGIEGRSFNLVADPCLSAQEYLDELDCAGAMKVRRVATPILKFYAEDTMKWIVKIAVRHPERRMPSYRDWNSRTGRAVFDCSAAKSVLGWKPTSDRAELIQRGIVEPVREFLD